MSGRRDLSADLFEGTRDRSGDGRPTNFVLPVLSYILLDKISKEGI